MLHTSRVLPGVSPAAAWALLTDTRRWPEWGPTVSAATVTSSASPFVATGSTGRVRTPVGVWLPFEVTEFDEGHRWSWRVTGVPATSHEVEPAGADGCRVSFLVPTAAAPYLAVCALALRRIERLLTGG